jgi:subtilisin family serine protease
MRRSFVPLVAVCSVLTTLFAVALGPLTGTASASDDPYFELQWSLAQIRAEDSWRTSTGSGVKIGIIDTGIDSDHPDLAPKIDATANCVGGTCRDGEADDGHGHGTLVSGIAAAAVGNGRGVAGVAPDARLVVAKAVDDQGKGDVTDIINAIRWAVDRGARIVNLSVGDPNFLVTSLLGTPLRPGIEYAWSKGAIPVLASGNENVGVLDLGSSNYGTLNALVVGSTDRTGGIAPYSSPIGNAKWGLVAPGGNGAGQGEDILSTYPGGRYAWVAGTSMAAPHVSGALALLLARGLNPSAAVQRLLTTADRSVRCGAGCQGRLNVAAAVGGTGPASLTPTTSPATSAPATTTGPRPAAVTTTTGPPAGPRSTLPATTDSTTVDPERRVLAAGPLDGGGGGGRVAASSVALALAGAVWTALGYVGWRRLTTGEGW